MWLRRSAYNVQYTRYYNDQSDQGGIPYHRQTVIQWLPQDQIILHLLYIKLQEVEKIVEQLWKKHATSYSH